MAEFEGVVEGVAVYALLFALAALFLVFFLRELVNKNPVAWFTLAALVVAVWVGAYQGF